MSSLSLPPNAACKLCSGPIAPDALACPQCHTLVHAEQLERLSAEAKAHETLDQWDQAREKWLKMLELLPPDATQTEWVKEHARRIETVQASAPLRTPPADRKWAEKLGPLAPFALALAKGKFLLTLFNLKFFLTLGAFIGVYWGLFGAAFGIGFSLLVLFHEMGHFIDIKRRGLPADMPVFLPGLGAYVRWTALGVPLETRAAVSLAGPFAGWLASVFCLIIWWKTGSSLWAALARASAWLNVLNLIPIWVLDGGQAVLALSKAERYAIVFVCLVLWLLIGEGVFFLVAAGACWRLFTKDLPEQSSPATAAYFVSVLACLGLVLWIVPGKGFGNP